MKNITKKIKVSEFDSSLSELQQLIQQSSKEKASVLWSIFGPFNLLSSAYFKNFISEIPAKDIVIGCSSAGQIYNEKVIDESITLSWTVFESTQLKLFSEPILTSEQSHIVGEKLEKKIKENSQLAKGVFLLTDGLNVNGSEIIKGINSILGEQVVVSGGMAADSGLFESTWVVANRELKDRMAVAVAFYGDAVEIQTATYGGWEHFGPIRTITKSKGNIVYEIDGQPALELYKKYLGEQAEKLPASGLLFPLHMWPAEDKNKTLVRTILNVNEEDHSMIFAGDIPEGYHVQLMKANFERLIDGSSSLLKQIQYEQGGLSIAVSCIGRKLVLGQRIEEEIESYYLKIQSKPVQVGFYSFGEFAPLKKNESCELLNQSLTLTFITERKSA